MGNESPHAVCFLPSTMSTLSLTESVLSYFTCRTSTSNKSDQCKHGLIEDWQECLPSSCCPHSQQDHSPSNSSSNPSAAHLFESSKAEQRLCDWQAGFGSTGIALVSNFVEHQKSQFDTDQKCQDYAEKMLDHLAFSFAQVEVCMNQLS